MPDESGDDVIAYTIKGSVRRKGRITVESGDTGPEKPPEQKAGEKKRTRSKSSPEKPTEKAARKRRYTDALAAERYMRTLVDMDVGYAAMGDGVPYMPRLVRGKTVEETGLRKRLIREHEKRAAAEARLRRREESAAAAAFRQFQRAASKIPARFAADAARRQAGFEKAMLANEAARTKRLAAVAAAERARQKAFERAMAANEKAREKALLRQQKFEQAMSKNEERRQRDALKARKEADAQLVSPYRQAQQGAGLVRQAAAHPASAAGNLLLNVLGRAGPHGAAAAAGISAALIAPEIARAVIRLLGPKGGPLNHDWRLSQEDQYDQEFSRLTQLQRLTGDNPVIRFDSFGYVAVSDPDFKGNSLVAAAETRTARIGIREAAYGYVYGP